MAKREPLRIHVCRLDLTERLLARRVAAKVTTRVALVLAAGRRDFEFHFEDGGFSPIGEAVPRAGQPGIGFENRAISGRTRDLVVDHVAFGVEVDGAGAPLRRR